METSQFLIALGYLAIVLYIVEYVFTGRPFPLWLILHLAAADMLQLAEVNVRH